MAEATAVKPPANCTWCWPKPRIPRKANSEWEQRTLGSGEWNRLCNRCANIRLRNPYNALLSMRKIGSGEARAEIPALSGETADE